MTARHVTAVRLPGPDQLRMAGERAILVALDTALLLAQRALIAEHDELDAPDDTSPEGEPPAPQIALARSILILADSLHELVDNYLAHAEHLLHDSDESEPVF